MVRIAFILALAGLTFLAPLVYAGPQLASDLRVGRNWTLAADLAVKESKCTRWYLLVSTCGVDYVNRREPGRVGGTLNYIVFGSWAGERVTLLQSADDPGRIGSTLGLEHMQQRVISFAVFVALALAFLVGVLRLIMPKARSEDAAVLPTVPSVMTAAQPSAPATGRSFGRRTGSPMAKI
ncbi:hypothetical protein ACFQ12_27250 [Methylobacterium trifolii]